MAFRLKIAAISAFLALGGCGTSSTPPAAPDTSDIDVSVDLPPTEVFYWQTVPSAPLRENLLAAGTTVEDASGNQFVVATVSEGEWNHLIVRESTDSGNTWTVIVDFNLSPNANSSANGVVVDSSGNLFVGGNATGADGANHWLVLKVAAQGFGVTIQEDFQLERGLDTFLDQFIKIDDSHFIAVGRGTVSSGAQKKIIRQI